MSNKNVLKSCSLFRGFSDSGLAVVESICHERNIPAGTPIFVENMVADSMFIIKSGSVNLSMKNLEGKEIIFDTLSTYRSFGELSLLLGGHRLVMVSAVSNCMLIEISRRDFLNLQKQKPKICLKILIAIVRKFGSRLSNCREHIKPLVLSQLGE